MPAAFLLAWMTMPYATLQDLVDRFGERELIQLTDRVHVPPTTVDETIVGRALGDAEALIDGYVGKIYALPLATVPTALVKVASDIARYFLHGKSAEKDGPVLRAYSEGLAWLKDVSRGIVQLDVGGAVPAAAGGGSIRASRPDRVFTRDSLKGM